MNFSNHKLLNGRFLLYFLLIVALFFTACGQTDEPPLPTVVIPTREGSDSGEVAVPTQAAENVGEVVATVTLAQSENPNPTPTLAVEQPTPTAAPTTPPQTSLPTQQLTSGSLPPISRDLIFIADGALKQWSQRSGQIDIIITGPNPASRISETGATEFVGDVTSFVLNGDGKRAVVARRTGTITLTETGLNENDVEEIEEITFPIHELLFVDMVSRDIWQIVPQLANLQSMDLSPNAQQVAFVASNLNNDLTLNEEGLAPQQMFVVSTGGGASPGQVRTVGACVRSCSPPVWHVESNLVMWSDYEALKLFNIEGSEAEPFLPNQVEPPNVAIHVPLAWANNGRFLLINKGALEGASKAIFDVPTRRLIDIPDSFIYVDPFPIEMMWMPDDRLFVLRTGRNLTPTAELWRVHIDDGNIVKEESLVLSNAQVGALGQQYLQDGRFAFALVSPDPALAGVYHLTSLSQQPEKVNAIPASSTDLPIAIRNVIWSADGSGAIVIYNDTPYYAPADGDYLYDMAAVFGTNAHSFHWQRQIITPQ